MIDQDIQILDLLRSQSNPFLSMMHVVFKVAFVKQGENSGDRFAVLDLGSRVLGLVTDYLEW